MKDVILSDTNLRLSRILDDYESDNVLKLVAQLTSTSSYEIFGCSVKCIEGAEHIHLIIMNGLHDDAFLGVCRNEFGIAVVQSVCDDFKGPCLSEDDLVKLVTLKLQAEAYWSSNATILRSTIPNRVDVAVEGRLDEYNKLPPVLVRKEYRRLQDLYRKEIGKYTWDT